ncbi:MAG: hypothetical protein U0470_08400 [Anaerolineae bacterium]
MRPPRAAADDRSRASPSTPGPRARRCWPGRPDRHRSGPGAHFDDAALSLGATIHRWTHEGLRVVVVTMCGAAPPPNLSPSWPSTAAARSTWGDAAAVVKAAAPRTAPRSRSCWPEPWAMDVPDAIYRRVHHRGRDLAVCRRGGALRPAAPPEPPWARAIADALGAGAPGRVRRAVDVPLGIGGRGPPAWAGQLAGSWRGAPTGPSSTPTTRMPAPRRRGQVLAARPAASRPPTTRWPPGRRICRRSRPSRPIARSTFWPSEDAMAADVGSWSERIWRPGAMDEGG